MVRQIVAAVFVLALAAAGTARAGDEEDKEALREKILKKVEERLKAENKRIMEEVKKILDEELSKMDEGEEDEKPPPKKKPDPKPKPKPEPEEEEEEDGEPGYMGVYPEDLREGMRELLKLKEDEGVMIVEVVEGGPAAKGGLKANDVVIAVGGKKVGTAEGLREAIQAHGAGETIKMTVLRKKEKVDLKVKLASRAEMEAGPEEEEADPDEEEEKPAKKPKVVFEPRAEAPRYDDMTEKELRESTRKLLDELLKKEKGESTPKTKKLLAPRFGVEIRWEGEEEETPEAEKGHDLRELTKRFLRDLLERMEEGEAMEEEEAPAPFGDMDEELKELMEKFEEFRGEELGKLKERFQDQMEKLQDEEFFKKMVEGMNPEALQEQLQRLLGGMNGEGEDEENLLEPEGDPQPQPEPKAGRAWLGVTPEELTEDLKSQLNLESGVLIGGVSEGSPAADAGLKEGDVLLSVDGNEVEGPDDLRARLAAMKPGAEVKLTIQRKGKQIEKTATLAVRKKISVVPTWEPIGDERGKKKNKVEKKQECQEPCCKEKRAKAAKGRKNRVEEQEFEFRFGKEGKKGAAKKSGNRKSGREDYRFDFEMPKEFRKAAGEGMDEAHKALRKALDGGKLPGEARKAIEKLLRERGLNEFPKARKALGKKGTGNRAFEFEFGDAEKSLKRAREELEKALKQKGTPKRVPQGEPNRKFERRSTPKRSLQVEPGKKVQRKVILETEEPGKKPRRLVIDPDELRHEGENLREELEHARKSLEKMLKEKKGTPKELREELEELRDWFEKMQKSPKRGKKGSF